MKRDALYCWNFSVILNMFLCCINKVLNTKIRSFVLFYLHKPLNPDISNPELKLFLSFRLYLCLTYGLIIILWLLVSSISIINQPQICSLFCPDKPFISPQLVRLHYAAQCRL